MTDYIKREDAVRRIAVLMAAEAESDGCEDQPMDNYIEYASEDLADIPSADVAPVRHGCLVDAGVSASGHRLAMCTICKRKMREGVEIGIVSRYCPNCGAKMDGGDTDA